MNKKIKSAVISIAVIAVLLLAILIGVKNGTLEVDERNADTCNKSDRNGEVSRKRV